MKNRNLRNAIVNTKTIVTPSVSESLWEKYKRCNTIVIPQVMKSGGKTNVIPDGVLHREKNDMGDKGLPVVDNNNTKRIEIEKEELILNIDATKYIEDTIEEYNNTDDSEKDKKDAILDDLGAYMYDQVMNNTEDKSGRFKDLTS